MKSKFIEEVIKYDGSQLRSHWIYERCGIMGDAIVAFTGPADVPLTNMVDLADVQEGKNIFSESMLHFIVEHFDPNLRLAVARQRLLVAIAKDEMMKASGAPDIVRSGDDIFDGDRKLSVSIATASPVSSLIHFAINISSRGTPVLTKGLEDYGIEPNELANSMMKMYVAEVSSMEAARCKVRAVK